MNSRHSGEVLLTDGQLNLAFIETENGIKKYEYQVLVTSLPDELLAVAQHYRDRGDCENCFDELKNQWGWGGFTTKDLHRCRIISRLVALVYNWWSLYARLLNPDKHHEATTSRPLMLQSVGRKTTHAGQTTVTVTSTHAKVTVVQAAMQELTRFFKELTRAAEQLGVAGRVRLIAQRAFRKLLASLPPLPTPKLLPATEINDWLMVIGVLLSCACGSVQPGRQSGESHSPPTLLHQPTMLIHMDCRGIQ